MSIKYISDRTGQDIPEGDRKSLWISIVLDSSYLPEAIKFKRAWDVTKLTHNILGTDALTLKNAIEAAVAAFINKVENP